MAAAEVGDAWRPARAWPARRRAPGSTREQVHQVAGPEEALAAGEHVLVVLVPAEAGAGAERLLDRGVSALSAPSASSNAPGRKTGPSGSVSAKACSGVIEYDAVRGVVLHVAAGGLAAQPLVDVALVGAGRGRRARGRRRAGGEAAVEAEPLAEEDVAGGDGGAEVADDAGRRTPSARPCRSPAFGLVVSLIWSVDMVVSLCRASRVDAGRQERSSSPVATPLQPPREPVAHQRREEAMRAREPDEQGYVEREGVRIGYESFGRRGGDDRPVVFVPGDTIVERPALEGPGRLPRPALPGGDHRPARQRPLRPARRPADVRRPRVRRPTRPR